MPRTRLCRRRLPARTHCLLLRLARVQGRLAQVVSWFNAPTAGPGGSQDWADRLLRGDPTIILDAAEQGREELDKIAADIENDMAKQPPTTAQPGSPEKIAVLQRRVQRFLALHVEGDAR